MNGTTSQGGKELMTFLYPRAHTRHSSLSFPVEESVVCVTLLEGLVDRHVQSLSAHQPHHHVQLLQMLRHDVWTAVQHLSVSFEDVWIYLAPLHALTTAVDQTPLSESVLPRPSLKAKANTIALVAVVRAQQRFDHCVLVTSLQAACQGGPFLFRRTTQFLSSLFKHINSSFILSSNLQWCGAGVALSDSDKSVLQGLQYVSSTNQLEDAITPKGPSTPGDTNARQSIDYDPVGPNFDPEPQVVSTFTMADIRSYFAEQSMRREEEEIKRYQAAAAAEATRLRNVQIATTRSHVALCAPELPTDRTDYSSSFSKDPASGRKTFDLSANRRLAPVPIMQQQQEAARASNHGDPRASTRAPSLAEATPSTFAVPLMGRQYAPSPIRRR